MKKNEYLQIREKLISLVEDSIEYNELLEQLEKELPFENIGQGIGFKHLDYTNAELDDIVYIPELCEDESIDKEGVFEDTSVYTKQDFKDIAKGQAYLEVYLFEVVDWQHPETLLDEWANNRIIDDMIEEGLILDIAYV